MGNSYFKFKQFTIQQQHSAMKVTTDACLFGAWLADKKPEAKSILDIGGGTGLLSLMLAQQTNGTICAVEKDEATCNEMRLNFDSSPWTRRLLAVNEDILKFRAPQTFDLVITNPPFFENSLKSPDENRNRVLHDTDLSIDNLVPIIHNLLTPSGAFAILLPHHRVDYFIEMAKTSGFHLLEKVYVQQTPCHQAFRSMLLFSKNEDHSTDEITIVIREENADYSEAFKALLKPYYLYL